MISSLRAIVSGALLLAGVGACDKAKAKDARPLAAPSPASGAAAAKPAAVAAAWTEADPGKPVGPQLAVAASAATRAGKKPFAYLHAAWCGPCKAIAATRETDPQMKAAFAGTVILGLDIDAVPAAELTAHQLAANAIPTFYRLDASGKVTGDSIDGGAWGEDVPANMAPPLAAFFGK